MKFSVSKFAIIAVGVFLTLPMAHAGNEGKGGGDPCEDRIKTIRDDIQSWIKQSGSKELILSKSMSVEDYDEKMSAQIKKSKIVCVGKDDPGYPVTINETPKVCRFDRNKLASQITCDLMKFENLSESDQYVLIHHEYAGLASIEKPNGDDSNYAVSDQITGFLVNQVVKKLAVKPNDYKLGGFYNEKFEEQKNKFDFTTQSFMDLTCKGIGIAPIKNEKQVVASYLKLITDVATVGRIKEMGSSLAIRFFAYPTLHDPTLRTLDIVLSGSALKQITFAKLTEEAAGDYNEGIAKLDHVVINEINCVASNSLK